MLALTQTDVFQKFQTEHPDMKKKLRQFESLKPFFVKGAKERDRQTMHWQHVEIEMLFKDCMKFRSQIAEKAGAEATIYSSLAEVISQTQWKVTTGSTTPPS